MYLETWIFRLAMKCFVRRTEHSEPAGFQERERESKRSILTKFTTYLLETLAASMVSTHPSVKAVHKASHHASEKRTSNMESKLWRFLAPRPAKKATAASLPMIRNMLPTTFLRTHETSHPCTPPSRTSLPLTSLYVPSLDDDDRNSPEVATVVADRHVEREDAPVLPMLDDTDTPPPSLRAVTPNLADESDLVEEDDESPRSARINLCALFEEAGN